MKIHTSGSKGHINEKITCLDGAGIEIVNEYGDTMTIVDVGDREYQIVIRGNHDESRGAQWHKANMMDELIRKL